MLLITTGGSPVIIFDGSPTLVGAGEDDAAVGGFAGEDAAAFFLRGIVGNAADGGFGEFLDTLFGLGGAVPMAKEESAFFYFFLELLPSVDGAGVGGAEVGSALEEGVLYVVHELEYVVGDAFDGHGDFLQGVAAAHFASAVLEVAGADSEAYGHAFEFVFVEFPAGFVFGAVVVFHGEAFGAELVDKGSDVGVEFGHLFIVFADGDYGHLDGCEFGREYEAVVVAVGHDECAHKASGDAPGGGPYVLELVLGVEELDFEGFGEVLSEEVGGAGLQGFAVLHHGFDAVGVEGTGEAFVGRFYAFDDGHGHPVLGEVGIDVEHAACFFLSFLAGGVGGVAFLPEEFGGAEEHAGAHFPAHYVGPLVAENGEVAVGFDPVLVGGPYNGFGGGADDELFFKAGGGVDNDTCTVGVVHETVVGNHGAFFGEAFYMLGFTAEERLGDEEGEVSVLVAGGFEHVVEGTLHFFPDGVAIWFDDHASANGGVFGQIGADNELVVPFGVVF